MSALEHPQPLRRPANPIRTQHERTSMLERVPRESRPRPLAVHRQRSAVRPPQPALYIQLIFSRVRCMCIDRCRSR